MSEMNPSLCHFINMFTIVWISIHEYWIMGMIFLKPMQRWLMKINLCPYTFGGWPHRKEILLFWLTPEKFFNVLAINLVLWLNFEKGSLFFSGDSKINSRQNNSYYHTSTNSGLPKLCPTLMSWFHFV